MKRVLLVVGALAQQAYAFEPNQQLTPFGSDSQSSRFSQMKQLQGGDPLAQLTDVRESVFSASLGSPSLPFGRSDMDSPDLSDSSIYMPPSSSSVSNLLPSDDVNTGPSLERLSTSPSNTDIFGVIARNQLEMKKMNELVEKQRLAIRREEEAQSKLNALINTNKAILNRNEQALKAAGTQLLNSVKSYTNTLLTLQKGKKGPKTAEAAAGGAAAVDTATASGAAATASGVAATASGSAATTAAAAASTAVAGAEETPAYLESSAARLRHHSRRSTRPY